LITAHTSDPSALWQRLREHPPDPYCALFLTLVIGSPVMVVQNVDVSSGVANGTIGTVVDVILNSDAVITFDRAQQVHVVGAQHVHGIVVRHTSYRPSASQQYGSLQENEFPVPVWTAWDKAKRTVRFQGKQLELGIAQLACVPASALTGHKIQGATLASLLIASWARTTAAWKYVALSRVRSRDSLFLLHQLVQRQTHDKHLAAVNQEMGRLQRELFDPTSRRLRDLVVRE